MTPKPYKELIEIHGPNLSYELLLGTTEWALKKNEIESRDKYRCVDCGNIQTAGILESGHFGAETISIEIPLPDGENYIQNKTEVHFQDRFYYLAVHHLYYVYSKLPWEYPNEALITLCNHCHKRRHELDTIIVYRDDTRCLSKHLSRCSKCDGLGYISEFKHVQNGVCFQCGGRGYDDYKAIEP